MNYWERRQAEDAYEAFEDAEKTAKVIARYYAGASSFLIRKAERVFEKFRQKHHLTEAEAKALLSRVRDKKSAAELLERLRASVNRQEKEELLSEIEAPAYRARLMRLVELQDNTDRVMQALYTKENDTSTEFYKKLAEESYLKEIYRTQQRANAAFSFGSVDKKTVDRVLRSKWSGKNYSERIWDNTRELADTLKDEIILSFLTGKGERDMARSIQDRFRVGANTARRLVRTESNHIRTEMDFEAYKEVGVEEYQYLATLDLRTSKICRSLDGKIFKVSNRKVGENCPPMHPWCRSTTISVIDRDLLDTMQRAAIDPATGERIMVPRTMTYQEWYEKYVKDVVHSGKEDTTVRNLTKEQYKNYKLRFKNDFHLTYIQFVNMKENVDLWRAYKQSYADSGKNELYNDLTTLWIYNARHNNARVIEAESYTAPDGRVFRRGDNGVVYDHEDHEIKTGELLSKATAARIELCPRVAGKNTNINTPDYIQNGQTKWDKKRPEGKGKDAIRDIVKKHREQADNFIIDLSKWAGDKEDALRQAEKLFVWKNTEFIRRIIVIDGDTILKVMSRK